MFSDCNANVIKDEVISTTIKSTNLTESLEIEQVEDNKILNDTKSIDENQSLELEAELEVEKQRDIKNETHFEDCKSAKKYFSSKAWKPKNRKRHEFFKKVPRNGINLKKPLVANKIVSPNDTIHLDKFESNLKRLEKLCNEKQGKFDINKLN